MFELSAAEWLAFMDRLQEPARVKPKLAELLSKPTVFDEEDADV
jgi:uncharacterized protein (DUF1778 family)